MCVLKVSNPALERNLEDIIRFSASIWEKPKMQWFTCHDLKHSKEILYLLDSLLYPISDTKYKLTEDESFVLLASVYLHDIGMQYLKKLNVPMNLMGDKEYGLVRKRHCEVVYDIIMSRFESVDPTEPQFPRITEEYVPIIAEICKGHGTDYFEEMATELKKRRKLLNRRFRGDLLVALLMIGDELDLTSKRVDFSLMETADIPENSLLHWFKHHYVDEVNITNGVISIVMKFPQNAEAYEDYMCDQVLGKLRTQMNKVNAILSENTGGILHLHDVKFDKLVEKTKVKRCLPSNLVDLVSRINKIDDNLNSQKTGAAVVENGGAEKRLNDNGLISLVDDLISLYRDGNVVEYYNRVCGHEKIPLALKRAGLHDQLIRLAEVDLETSYRSKEPFTILSYSQACIVLCDVRKAISVIHRKLNSDSNLSLYSIVDQAQFIRTYAEVLISAGRADLSVKLLENLLSSSIVKYIKHHTLSHVFSVLGIAYLEAEMIPKALDIAQQAYDEQCLTKNAYATAICAVRLGIVLVRRRQYPDANHLFEYAISVFHKLDDRAEAWAMLYAHVVSLRTGGSNINYLQAAMKYYICRDDSSKELLDLLLESKKYLYGWHSEFDPVIERMSVRIEESNLEQDMMLATESYCATLLARPVCSGANAIEQKVSLGGFRLNSVLTVSFIKNLNKAAKEKYLRVIMSNERYYLHTFYNRLVFDFTNGRRDKIEEIVLPVLNGIACSSDNIRLFYVKLLERNGFIKEADDLIETVGNKKQFKYLNNKGNILSHNQSSIETALLCYQSAIKSTKNDQLKSIAYHNMALMILRRRARARYNYAEECCLEAINYRQNDRFTSPEQTLLLLRIDKVPDVKIIEVIKDHQASYGLPLRLLRDTLNQIKSRSKYITARQYLIEQNTKS